MAKVCPISFPPTDSNRHYVRRCGVPACSVRRRPRAGRSEKNLPDFSNIAETCNVHRCYYRERLETSDFEARGGKNGCIKLHNEIHGYSGERHCRKTTCGE